jgi:hypothetical protein
MRQLAGDVTVAGSPFSGSRRLVVDPWSAGNMNLSPEGVAPRRDGDLAAMNGAYNKVASFRRRHPVQLNDWRHYSRKSSTSNNSTSRSPPLSRAPPAFPPGYPYRRLSKMAV